MKSFCVFIISCLEIWLVLIWIVISDLLRLKRWLKPTLITRCSKTWTVIYDFNMLSALLARNLWVHFFMANVYNNKNKALLVELLGRRKKRELVGSSCWVSWANLKKTRPVGERPPPRYFTQPEPGREKSWKLAPSYMGMPPPMVRAMTCALRPNPHDQPTTGQFTHADQENHQVTFFYPAWNSLPQGFEPWTWGATKVIATTRIHAPLLHEPI